MYFYFLHQYKHTTELQHFTISHFNFYVSQMTSIDIDCAIWREKCLSFKRVGEGVVSIVFLFESDFIRPRYLGWRDLWREWERDREMRVLILEFQIFT